MNQYIGVEELGRLMGLSKNTIYRRRTYMPTAVPPAIKIGGRLRWQLDTVSKWLEEHEEAAQ